MADKSPIGLERRTMSKRLDEWWVMVATKKQEFSVAAAHLREIVAWPEVTAVLHCRPQSRGVIYLRGRVIPLFDIRRSPKPRITPLKRRVHL